MASTNGGCESSLRRATMSSLPSASKSFNTEELVPDYLSTFRDRLDRLGCFHLNLVNLCVTLNTFNFHFTLAQTVDIILEFDSVLKGFQSEQTGTKNAGDRVFTFQKLLKSEAVANYRRSFLAKGYDVDLENVASLFNFLLHYNVDFRKEEFRTWYAQKRHRREAREKRRKHIAAKYQPEDARYQKGIEALQAEMKGDWEKEGKLLGLWQTVRGTWSSNSTIVLPHRHNRERRVFTE